MFNAEISDDNNNFCLIPVSTNGTVVAMLLVYAFFYYSIGIINTILKNASQINRVYQPGNLKWLTV